MTDEEPPFESSPPPTRVGDYVILEEIGAGGMGTVYLGRHVDTLQIAAVKVLPPALAREPGFRQRFAREIEAVSQLHSPHIVQFYGRGEDAERVYYAMEYVAGETLNDRLRRDKRLPWQTAVDYCLQLCSALKAAHDAGVIHRDLKPSNILLGNDGTVKLTDFGIAQVFAADKLTVTGGVVGTAEYMSPEQAIGQRASKRSDLYSLGAVLYVMLTGRPPFVGPTTLDILQKHRYGQFDLPSRYVDEIPHDLDRLVEQLLQKEPDKRLPDAWVLSRRLQELLQKQALRSGDVLTAVDVPHTDDAETRELPPAGQSQRSGPGDATLMRDLVRTELSREAEPRGIGRLLDNVWVLAGLLVLVVGGMVWMLRRDASPESRFEAGVALLQSPAGPDWLRARDEYFQPLVDNDAKTWQPRVDEYLTQIEDYEREQRLLSPRRSTRSPNSAEVHLLEPQLRNVRRLWDQGEYPAALKKLQAIQLFWQNDPTAANYLRIADKWAHELAVAIAESPDPGEEIQRQLAEAAQWEATDPARARRIRDAIVELYDGDPRVQSLVETAR